MWVRSPKGKDFSWEASEPLNVSTGQKLTLLFLNCKFVAFTNHNTDTWQYILSNNEIAKIAGQSGFLPSNGKEIAQHEKNVETGVSSGALVGFTIFFMALVIGRVEFWGWGWVEESSSQLWYILLGIMFVPVFIISKSADFRASVIAQLVIGAVSWYFDFHEWAAFIMLFMVIALTSEPNRQYTKKFTPDALNRVKKVIKHNANIALKNFK